MNIPIKLIKTPVINDNFSFLQNLAKKYHKSSKGRSNKVTETTKLLEFYEQPSFKEEIVNWLFSLNFKERMKAVSIENKWLATMIQQMYQKQKYDSKIKFQLKSETFNEEELYLSNYLGNGIQNQNYVYNQQINEFQLEGFFNVKAEHCKYSILFYFPYLF